ncbi:GntR family transcriptional regulator [Streptomyces beijiangensis]|uniref:GntR family transcriptional regulator n=1 Tax=Streptomyces beijiangensis TaxID=163361 RepID=UPI0031CDF4CC
MPRPPSRTQQVAEQLRARIRSGELQPEAPLPSTKRLAEEYGIGQESVRLVVKQLKASGDVVSQWGKGVFVRTYDPFAWDVTTFERGQRPDDVTTTTDAWAAGIRAQGHEPAEQLLYVSEAPGEAPPRDTARRLQLEDGDLAVCRRRLRTVDGNPYQLSESWFPARIALGSPLMNTEATARPGGILASINHPQVRGRDRYEARLPTQFERDTLKLEVGTTVLGFTRTGFGADGVPVRCMYTICPGDKTVIEMDVEF